MLSIIIGYTRILPETPRKVKVLRTVILGTGKMPGWSNSVSTYRFLHPDQDCHFFLFVAKDTRLVKFSFYSSFD